MRTFWAQTESTSQGRPLNVRFGGPRDCQKGSLGDVLGTTLRPIFAGWVRATNRDIYSVIFCPMKNYIKKITKIFEYMTFHAKPLPFMFDKMVYNRSRSLVLFDYG